MEGIWLHRFLCFWKLNIWEENDGLSAENNTWMELLAFTLITLARTFRIIGTIITWLWLTLGISAHLSKTLTISHVCIVGGNSTLSESEDIPFPRHGVLQLLRFDDWYKDLLINLPNKVSQIIRWWLYRFFFYGQVSTVERWARSPHLVGMMKSNSWKASCSMLLYSTCILLSTIDCSPDNLNTTASLPHFWLCSSYRPCFLLHILHLFD